MHKISPSTSTAMCRLRALDPLTGVVTPASLAYGDSGLDRLGIDDGRGGLRAAAGQDADLLAKLVVHPGGGAALVPVVHVSPHGAPVRQVSGPRPPHAPVMDQVADPVDDITAAIAAR